MRRRWCADTITPAVHYIRFAFTPAQVAAFADLEEVALVARHPEYRGAYGPSRPGASGTAGRPAWHNKAASYRLTRDNSCVGLYRRTGRRPYSSFAGIRCRRRWVGPSCAPD